MYICFFDEVGQVASQYDYDFESVKVNIQTFIRFYGHFIKDGYVFSTEQSSDFIAKPIRARFNGAIEVRRFRRCFGILPFGKVSWQLIKITNDVMNTKDVKDTSWNVDFFWFPYVRRYDAHCYSEAYELGFTHELPPEEWDCKVSMKTRYLPDVRRKSSRNIFKPVKKDPESVNLPQGDVSGAAPPAASNSGLENGDFPLLDITDIIPSLSEG